MFVKVVRRIIIEGRNVEDMLFEILRWVNFVIFFVSF